MVRHIATFEIDSKPDSFAARRILERTYDTVREESRQVRAGSEDGAALLAEFEALRDAAERPSPGRLTITYEADDGSFDD